MTALKDLLNKSRTLREAALLNKLDSREHFTWHVHLIETSAAKDEIIDVLVKEIETGIKYFRSMYPVEELEEGDPDKEMILSWERALSKINELARKAGG